MTNAAHAYKVRIGQGATAQLSGTVIQVVSAVAISVAITRWLGFEAFGLYSMGYAAAQLTSLASRAGLDLAAVHHTARSYGGPNQASGAGDAWAALRMAAIMGAAAGALLWVAAPSVQYVIGDSRSVDVLRLFAFTVPFANVFFVATGALRGALQANAHTVLFYVAYPGLRALLIGLVALTTADLELVVAATLTATVITALTAVAWLARVLPVASSPRGRLLEMLRFGGWSTASRAAHNGLQWVDLAIVILLLPSLAAGQYRAAAQAAPLLVMVLTAMGLLFAPICSRLLTQGEHRALEDVAQSIARLCLFLSGTFGIVLLVEPMMVLFVFGEGVEPAVPVFRFLAAAYLCIAALGPFANILIMGGTINLDFRATAIALALAGVVGVALVPVVGIAGAGIGALAGLLCRSWLQLWFVWSRHSITPLSRPLGKGIAAAGALVTLGMGGVHAFGGQSFLLAPLCGVAFGIWTWHFMLTHDDRLVLRTIVQSALPKPRGLTIPTALDPPAR